mgnify:CR=1 FL=1
MDTRKTVGVVGLGYVGLPLAVLLTTRHDVVGFDTNPDRIEELKRGFDFTGEVDKQTLDGCNATFTHGPEALAGCRIIIVTVPTPIDTQKRPDLGPLMAATRTVGRHLQKGSVVVYESTVYPGLTEEECVPVLEAESGLTWRQDFNVGYSPERVNPGDKDHTIDRIVKVVAGDSPESADLLCDLYSSVVTAGVHRAPDIKTAEAAKVIENTQRDLNIALMNELSIIFNRLGIDTHEVLKAAGTKWNFLPFVPGLVGGHCIGVDPYYLTYKAENIGYHPRMILAGRRINDNMGKHVAENTVKKLIAAGKRVKGSRVLIMGLTFKEDISDIRNTRVHRIHDELREYGVEALVYDPHAESAEVKEEYGIDLLAEVDSMAPYDGIIVAVKHRVFLDRYDLDAYRGLATETSPVLVDVKGLYQRKDALERGFIYWRL